MLSEKSEDIRTNREKVRADLRNLISKNSRLSFNRETLEEGLKKPDLTISYLQSQNSRKNLQRKKSLNIDILPRSFEMFECGEV